MNRFADWTCERQNARVCKATGIAPNIAFRATTNPFRKIDPAQFDAAFKARDLNLRIHPDLTIAVDGQKYQLSRRDEYPFQELAVTKQKVDVYWIDDEDFFAVVTPAGDEFVIEKVIARADTAGEFKALPESVGEKTRKDLKASQKERIKDIRAQQKQTEDPVLVVPGIDTDEQCVRDERILDFPQRVETGDVERLHELTYQLANDAPEYSRQLDTWAALEYLQDEHGVPKEPCSELAEVKTWLRTVFNGSEVITEADLRTAFDQRGPAADRRLAAVR